MIYRLQYGLLAVMVLAMVACGGGGGGGGGKKSSSSSVVASSAATSVAVSSMAASSVAESSIAASSVSSVVSSVEASSTASSESSSSAGITTTFNVNITSPLGEAVVNRSWSEKLLNFLVGEALADSEDVPLANLAVVVVDLAGNVIETIPLNESNSTQNPDGSWSLSIPGYPQLDCIVIANLDGPITLVNTNNIFDLYPNALFSPTTDEDLDVDIASTAAYTNLLDELGGTGTFESLNLDVNDPTQLAVLENLIETVRQVIEDQIFLGANDIAAALAQIQEQVVEIVQVEATNVTSAVESTLSDAMATGGGFHWYEGFEAQEINHGAFVGETVETIYIYNGTEFELSPENQEVGNLVLGAEGWIEAADFYSVQEQNEDGSLTLSDVEAPIEQINLKSTQSFNLATRNIADFFSAYTDTKAIAGILNPDHTFAEGSIAYRANLTSINSVYSLDYEPGYGAEAICPWNKDGDPENELASEFGGNCETVSSWTFSGEGFPQHTNSVATVAALKSADVAYNGAGSRLVPIGGFSNNSQSIAVQLVDNTAKTANYFWYDWQTNLATTIGQGTWSQITLPNLEGDAAIAVSLTLPDTVKEEGDFDNDERNKIFAVHNGLVRPGNHSEAGELFEVGFLVLNGIASDSVIAATNYKAPIVGSWLDEDTEGATPAVLTFINNLQYTVTSFSSTECSNGLETGFYAVSNDSLSANPEVEADGDCGLSSLTDGNTVTVEGNTLTITEGLDVFTFTRLEGEGVLGTWIGQEPPEGDHELILSFLPENRFVFSQHGFSDSANGNNGYEYGTYTLDSATGAFVPSVSINKDGTWGFSHSEVTYTLTTAGNDLTLTVHEGEAEFVVSLKRVTGPVN